MFPTGIDINLVAKFAFNDCLKKLHNFESKGLKVEETPPHCLGVFARGNLGILAKDKPISGEELTFSLSAYPLALDEYPMEHWISNCIFNFENNLEEGLLFVGCLYILVAENHEGKDKIYSILVDASGQDCVVHYADFDTFEIKDFEQDPYESFLFLNEFFVDPTLDETNDLTH